MYKVLKTNKVINKLDYFIESFLNSFLVLFEDSGIQDVDIIKNNYIKISKDFKNNILSKFRILEEEKLFWYKNIDNKIQISFIIWNYRFFIYFTEDDISKIRVIEDIEIFKK